MTSPKRILVACIHYPVASGRYIARALRRLGHDVRTVGPCTGNEIWGIKVDERHVWTPDIVDTQAQQGMGLTCYIGDAWHPIEPGWYADMVLTADSAYTLAPSRKGGPYVLYGVDNHVRTYTPPLGGNWDHMFLAHHDGPALPVDDARPDMHYLPCGYDPEYFTPSPIPWEDRDYDVAMVGVGYPRRAEIVNAMMEAGLKVFAATGLLFEDYAAIYHNARISLCVSAAGDVAQRVFETAALGCLILSDPCADFGRLRFTPWRHYVPYATTDEAVQGAIMMIRTSPQAAQDMVVHSTRWALPHTWDNRCQILLETVFEEASEPCD